MSLSEQLQVDRFLMGRNAMLGRFALGAIVAALTAGYSSNLAASTGGSHNWQSYREPSSGVSVNIPRDLFPFDAGPSLVGTGHLYSSPDQSAFIAVYSVPKPADGRNPVEDLVRNQELKNGAVVTYRRATRRFFVASGFDGDNVFYDRCNFAGPSEKCVHVEYPKKDIRSWDKIVTRISLSLRG
jgi:hypothetical protein